MAYPQLVTCSRCRLEIEVMIQPADRSVGIRSAYCEDTEHVNPDTGEPCDLSENDQDMAIERFLNSYDDTGPYDTLEEWRERFD